jgi:hypothetical protein
MQIVQSVNFYSNSVSVINIPQTGTDLLLLLSMNVDFNTTNATFSLYFNNNTSSSYNFRRLRGQPASGVSSVGNSNTNIPTSGEIPGRQSGLSTFGSASIYIPNYTSGLAKSLSIETVSPSLNSNAPLNLVAQLWNGTAAITSIQLAAQSQNTMRGSLSLYTITKA